MTRQEYLDMIAKEAKGMARMILRAKRGSVPLPLAIAYSKSQGSLIYELGKAIPESDPVPVVNTTEPEPAHVNGESHAEPAAAEPAAADMHTRGKRRSSV